MKLCAGWIFLFTITSFIATGQTTKPTGLIFNDNAYLTTPRLSQSLKWNGPREDKVSLRNFCPEPGDQRDIASCVGWATGYGCLTTCYAIQHNIQDKALITSRARSAMFIYNQIKLSFDCSTGGSDIFKALQLLKSYGDCLHTEFDPYNCNTGIQPGLFLHAAQFKIKDFYKLFEANAYPDEKISAVINSLQAKKPVIVGMDITPSLSHIQGGRWNPFPGEQFIGGHALCVVGFDNNTEEFEILNSWGANWGDNGFFFIPYQVFSRLCRYGFQINLREETPQPTVKLTGNFTFKKFIGYNSASNTYNFSEAPVVLKGSYYTLESAVNKNDFYRIQASNIRPDNYIYIISLKPDNTTEILFPSSSVVDGVTVKELPIIPSNQDIVEIPADPKKGLTTDKRGNDILCILFSSEQIEDIESVVNKIRHGSGEFESRLNEALGERLVSQDNIAYESTKMAFTANSNASAYVIPLILKVDVQ